MGISKSKVGGGWKIRVGVKIRLGKSWGTVSSKPENRKVVTAVSALSISYQTESANIFSSQSKDSSIFVNNPYTNWTKLNFPPIGSKIDLSQPLFLKVIKEMIFLFFPLDYQLEITV